MTHKKRITLWKILHPYVTTEKSGLDKLPEWQETYMEKLVGEYIVFLSQEDKPASDKFWELEKRIKKDKKNTGIIMELNKSEAIWDIVNLIRHKVISPADLLDFSEELQQDMKRILEVN